MYYQKIIEPSYSDDHIKRRRRTSPQPGIPPVPEPPETDIGRVPEIPPPPETPPEIVEQIKPSLLTPKQLEDIEKVVKSEIRGKIDKCIRWSVREIVSNSEHFRNEILDVVEKEKESLKQFIITRIREQTDEVVDYIRKQQENDIKEKRKIKGTAQPDYTPI